jgi:prolyl oligopeptidase
MENLADPEVQAWMKGQNAYARAVLASLPGRQQLLKRILELDESAGADIGNLRRLPGNVYLYTKLLPGEDTYKLYIRRGLMGEEKLLVDPERIPIAEANREKGAKVINYFAPSEDLRYVAFTITPGGSEYDTEIHIIETASGRETGDVVPRCCIESNPLWLRDNHSFVYGRWQKLPPGAPVTETRQKYRCYLHVLGTNPEKDQAVFGYGVAVDRCRPSPLCINPDTTGLQVRAGNYRNSYRLTQQRLLHRTGGYDRQIELEVAESCGLLGSRSRHCHPRR